MHPWRLDVRRRGAGRDNIVSFTAGAALGGCYHDAALVLIPRYTIPYYRRRSLPVPAGRKLDETKVFPDL